MKQFVLVMACLYGALSVMLGSLGAHMLKEVLTSSQLLSFETAVRYQLIHAVVLLVIGFNLTFNGTLQKVISFLFIVGVFLFSFSIFLLSTQDLMGLKMSFLGPITPMGGLCLVAGWIILAILFVKKQF